MRAGCQFRDPTRFVAIAFGAGDHRTRTEDRPPPPPLSPGDRLSLGPLDAVVERLLDHPRLFELRFPGNRAAVLAGLARHGRPIQYAHVPEPLALWDVWTKIAADPVAFEPPSAGFALDWRTLAAWRRRGVGFATLTHAAGISSTGDPALDLRLPFDEPYRIPERTAARSRGRSRTAGASSRSARPWCARSRPPRTPTAACAPETASRADASRGERRLRVVDAILTGVHQPGESHFELLRAFADDAALDQISAALTEHGYRAHEFGDSMLLHRQPPVRNADTGTRDFSGSLNENASKTTAGDLVPEAESITTAGVSYSK